MHRPRGRVRRDVRAGRHEPGHRPRGRAAGLRSDGGHHRAGPAAHDRHGRVPGDAHRGDHAADHQAQLPGDERGGHPARGARGVLPREQRPPRPGADRHPEGRAAADVRAVLGPEGEPERLPLAPAQPPHHGADAAGARHAPRRQEAGGVRGRRLPGRGAGAQGVHRAHRDPRHQHPDGPRVLPRQRRAVARHARHARRGVRQLRHRQRICCSPSACASTTA